jgi:hypothetical protein
LKRVSRSRFAGRNQIMDAFIAFIASLGEHMRVPVAEGQAVCRALAAPGVYRELVDESGWTTASQFQNWIADPAPPPARWGALTADGCGPPTRNRKELCVAGVAWTSKAVRATVWDVPDRLHCAMAGAMLTRARTGNAVAPTSEVSDAAGDQGGTGRLVVDAYAFID